MKTPFFLLAIATMVVGCAKSYYQPKVDLIMAYPFPSHNNYVEVYYNTDKFPDPKTYFKIGIIKQVSNSSEMEAQIFHLKRVAQKYGADGILILGINESGSRVAKQKKLGNDVVGRLDMLKETDYYTKLENNDITVLAIKNKKNLDQVNQMVKNMLMYKFDEKSNNFKLVDVYKFSFDNQIVAGDQNNPDFQDIKSYSSFFLTYDKSPNWKENARNKNLIVREYNDLLNPRLISSTSLNNEGNIEKIVKLYPRTQKKETITYTYQEKKPVGRTIVTKDNSILEENYTLNKQNKIEEVTIYNCKEKTKIPLYKLIYNYYSTNDLDSAITSRKIN